MFVALSHPTRAACDGSRAQTAQWCRAADGCARLHSQWQASLSVDMTLGGGTSSSRIWHDLILSPNVVFCCFHTQVETRFPAVRQAFRFVLGALLPILLKTSAMQYLPVFTSCTCTRDQCTGD